MTGNDEEFLTDIHRQIQTEWDWWFMEKLDTLSIIAANQSYALPTRFKREVSLWFTHATTGKYESPIQRLMRGQAEVTFTDPTDDTTYPTHYEIWGDSATPFKLWPIPDTNVTLNRRYYAYLPNLKSGTVTMTIATPCVVTLTDHNLASGDTIYFTTSGSLPTNISASTKYWVTVVDDNTFKLSTSYANYVAATFIATTGSQTGAHTMYAWPDTITKDHPYVIIYKAALVLVTILDYQQKIGLFSRLYDEALQVMRERDWAYKIGGDSGGLNKIDYVGF